MSAESVARWNAIPLDRTSDRDAERPNLKRSRSPENENGDVHMATDDEEDDVSLVSRSPSPGDSMEVDESAGLDKYDEYHRGAPREVITVETKIKPSNKGFAMLAKMGWSEGHPLGISGDGRVDPVPFYIKNDLTGLGKSSQDVRMIETTVAQRRNLDSERQQKETEEQRRAREDAVARAASIQSEISTTLRAFYCELCSKQFKNVAQYDEHTNSYAHHHKARARDMQAAAKLMQGRGTEEEVNKRKEKERKREEKELRKLAKAAGVKITPVAAPAASLAPAASNVGNPEQKKPGWATVPSTSAEPTPSSSSSSGGGFKKSGWASVAGSSSTPTSQPSSSRAPVQPQSSAPPPPPSSQPPATPANPTSTIGAAPTFRTGGWSSLDTGSTIPQMPPPPPPTGAPPAPAPAPSFKASGWMSLETSTPQSQPPAAEAPPPPPSRSGWSSVGPTSPSPSTSGWRSTSSSSANPPPPLPPSGPPPPSIDTAHENPATPSAVHPPIERSSPVPRPHRPPPPEEKRSSWQNFRKKAYR